jgi:integrase
VARLSARTVNKQLTAITTLLSWSRKNGYVETNVAAGLKVPVSKNADDGRQPYSVDDMRTVLAGLDEHTDRKPSKYWLPLLAAFTGARLEEVGQLTVDDVRHRDGIDYIDINAVDEGKSLKTRSSRRQVPLHPELVRLGFLDHVERRRASGGGPLFPDLKPDNHGVQTGNFSKWWGRHARRRGIEDRRKTFHSFRHGFKQAIREAGVGEEVHDALTGHSGGGVGRTYGGYPLGLKAGAIAKVKYPGLDLSSMYDRPVRKRSRHHSPPT